MDSLKEKLLSEALQKVLDMTVTDDFLLDTIGDYVVSDVMGFGTTVDEKITGLEGFKKLLEDQQEQSRGIAIRFNTSLIHQRIFANENAAYFSHDFIITIKTESDENVLPLRFSTVFEYLDQNWKLVHWHGSQAVDSEGDTWHRNELVKKNEALQKLVDEKTADLIQKNAELKQAILTLKETQTQLLQQEKLASLGQLTAGIAHEIKNPLNFVNNFSELSQDFIDEIAEELEKLQDSSEKENIQELLEDVKSNLGKIRHHGSRADSIVKSMLMHSRGGSGTVEPTDLNALIKEYSNLAFHGMRASPNPINVEIHLDLDENLGLITLNAEDFSRVVLNLIKNAFDAMRDKISMVGSNYKAKLEIRTKNLTNRVLVVVEDNGPGVPEDIRDKLLMPFFTTKKGTEGTGLGLSITHDIIKSHLGTLEIESTVGVFTRFTIELPINKT
ncbi:MAG: ATP-binding protein [Algoriphagus sp.]|uniref:sensor histidine kinase n=1 Tax=Algoriphagus sp. TaxID=1872435 RepID=UPI0027320766|nr:ATP-binding protein [Algoriphagus sp.]MDP2043171.1 ATP-binding protein [Algoriphagus sp.]MDP3470527.1 ATP-binding protein [Algoriphagus sp.]